MTRKHVNIHGRDLRQFLRYLVVGVMNTLVTLIVIFLCKSVFDINIWVSNALGYVAGVINSFIWNKLWVFNSRSGAVKGEMFRFAIGFAVCYSLQFAVTWVLNQMLGGLEWDLLGVFTMSGYGLATLVGMVCYTLANFIFNRLVTFRH